MPRPSTHWSIIKCPYYSQNSATFIIHTPLFHLPTPRAPPPARPEPETENFYLGFCLVGLNVIGCTMSLNTTSTVHRRQVKTATYDQRMSSWACMKCRTWVAQGLNSRRSKSSALTDVQIFKSFLLVPVFHRFPYTLFVLHSTVSQSIYCPVCDILAIVETERLQMKAIVCQSNNARICY